MIVKTTDNDIDIDEIVPRLNEAGSASERRPPPAGLEQMHTPRQFATRHDNSPPYLYNMLH